MTLHPLWPAWLLLVPALAVGFGIWGIVRFPRARWAWVRRVAVAVLLVVMLAAPSVEDRSELGVETTIEVYFVVDLTGSMGALDFEDDQPRLVGARHDVEQLARAFPSSRYSVIGWNSQATTQLPLTTDANAVIAWARSAPQEATRFSAGSQVDRPLRELEESLERAAELRPQNIRLVYFLSDGENTDGDKSSADAELESFGEVGALIDGGAVLGYGTDEGARMYQAGIDVPEEDPPFILDDAGEPAISRYDEGTLRTIAEQMGVPFLHRTTTDSLASLADDVPFETLAADGRGTTVTYRPVVWPYALAAALLVLWEAIDTVRQLRRPKAVEA